MTPSRQGRPDDPAGAAPLSPRRRARSRRAVLLALLVLAAVAAYAVAQRVGGPPPGALLVCRCANLSRPPRATGPACLGLSATGNVSGSGAGRVALTARPTFVPTRCAATARRI